MRQEGAGEKGVRCYRTACQTKNGIDYYNSSTKKYYCKDCADAINYWSMKDVGVNIVTYEKSEEAT